MVPFYRAEISSTLIIMLRIRYKLPMCPFHVPYTEKWLTLKMSQIGLSK